MTNAARAMFFLALILPSWVGAFEVGAELQGCYGRMVSDYLGVLEVSTCLLPGKEKVQLPNGVTERRFHSVQQAVLNKSPKPVTVILFAGRKASTLIRIVKSSSGDAADIPLSKILDKDVDGITQREFRLLPGARMSFRYSLGHMVDDSVDRSEVLKIRIRNDILFKYDNETSGQAIERRRGERRASGSYPESLVFDHIRIGRPD